MAEREVERRLAAILAADVVGYSRLMEVDEAGTLAAMKAHRRELWTPLTGRHGGRVVGTAGDSLLVEFASAVAAIECAVAVQRGMAERNADLPDGQRMLLRIGVNIGEVIVDGEDIYGEGVNIAARLEALCEPGGVALSGNVQEQVQGKLDESLEDTGAQEVKNIARPIRVWRWSEAAAAGPTMSGNEQLLLPDKPSVAVLPLDNMSGDPEQEYFSDGITEDIITALSHVRWLFVIARNSTFAYKGQSPDIREVARDLGVRYVLEGSVRKGGNKIRINAQLIDAQTGNHVWAQRYDRDLDDMFALQDEMTETIVAAIEPELASVERERARRKPPESLGAWECYQRGLWHLYQFTKDANAEAQAFFRRAIELDADFAPGYAGLGDALYLSMMHGYAESHAETLSQGFEAARRAVALDGKDAGARFTLGRLYYMKREHDASIAELKTAVALNPSFANAYLGLATAMVYSGKASEAIGPADDALRLSPHDPYLWILMVVQAFARLQLKDYEAALDWSTQAVRQPSAEITAYLTHASSLGHLGRHDEGRKAIAEVLRRKPDFSPEYVGNILPYKDTADLDDILDGLRKAGLPE